MPQSDDVDTIFYTLFSWISLLQSRGIRLEFFQFLERKLVLGIIVLVTKMLLQLLEDLGSDGARRHPFGLLLCCGFLWLDLLFVFPFGFLGLLLGC